MRPAAAAGRRLRLVTTAVGLLLPSLASAQGSVSGQVVDSLRGGPLAGAQIQMVLERRPDQLARSAVSDTVGAFRLDSVAPGAYLVGFYHPRLDSLGLRAPERRIMVGAGQTELTLAIPSAATLTRASCPNLDPDSSGLVLGRVRDGTSGWPLARGAVTLAWSELVLDGAGLRQEPRTRTATSGPDGRFALCGIPSDVVVTAWAEAGADASGRIALTVPPGGLRYSDFAVAPVDTVRINGVSAPLRIGTARLTGIVRQRGGRPLGDARVYVDGTVAADTTDRAGRFALARLPAGTQMLEVRALGFAPERVAVELRAGRTDSLAVVVDEPVAVLERVQVFGNRSVNLDRTGFLRRQGRALGGHFLSPEQLARRSPASVVDALRTIPGIRVDRPDLFSYTLTYRGCAPTVYLDGQYVLGGDSTISDMVTPAELAGVEVYSVASAPAEFLPLKEACGVVLLWTRGALHLPAVSPAR